MPGEVRLAPIQDAPQPTPDAHRDRDVVRRLDALLHRMRHEHYTPTYQDLLHVRGAS